MLVTLYTLCGLYFMNTPVYAYTYARVATINKKVYEFRKKEQGRYIGGFKEG